MNQHPRLSEDAIPHNMGISVFTSKSLVAITVALVLMGCTGRNDRPVVDRTPTPYSHVEGILSMTTEMDCDEAARIFKASVDDGDVRSLVNLGKLRESQCRLGSFDHGEFAAASIYAQAAERGDPVGQTNLGVLCITFMQGWLGSCRTYAEAANLFTKAADQGDMRAVVYLGHMHEKGYGVFPVDQQEAAALYKKASANGEKLGDVFLWDMENLDARRPRSSVKEAGK